MKKSILVVVVVVVVVILLAVALAGCGGGGGGSSTPSADTIQLWQAGDMWTYRATVSDGVSQQVVEGAMMILPDVYTDLAGNSYQSVPVAITGIPNAGRVMLMSQDSSGTVYSHGDFDPNTSIERLIIAADGGKRVVVRSPLVVGDKYSYSARLNDGTLTSGSSEVVSKESISVPAGTFTAYKVVSTDYEAGIVALTTEWYTPGKSAPVKSVVDADDNRITLELVSSTRSH